MNRVQVSVNHRYDHVGATPMNLIGKKRGFSGEQKSDLLENFCEVKKKEEEEIWLYKNGF